MKNVDNSGRPTNDRGRPPHKGGACAMKNKRAGKRKIYFVRGLGRIDGKGDINCGCSWKPGKSRNKYE